MSESETTPQEETSAEEPQKDEGALPTPEEKHAQAEADRKRLAEEHGTA